MGKRTDCWGCPISPLPESDLETTVPAGTSLPGRSSTKREALERAWDADSPKLNPSCLLHQPAGTPRAGGQLDRDKRAVCKKQGLPGHGWEGGAEGA